jgi:hypothetical protein
MWGMWGSCKEDCHATASSFRCLRDAGAELTAIWTKLKVFHDFLQRHQLADVYCRLVWQFIVDRVEVDHCYFAVAGAQELLHTSTIGRFTTARWPDHNLPERHRGARRMGDGIRDKRAALRSSSYGKQMFSKLHHDHDQGQCNEEARRKLLAGKAFRLGLCSRAKRAWQA